MKGSLAGSKESHQRIYPMKNGLALLLLSCVLVAFTACSSAPAGSATRQTTLAENQTAEARAALSSGQITMAGFLHLKQQAEQAESQRRAILFAAP